MGTQMQKTKEERNKMTGEAGRDYEIVNKSRLSDLDMLFPQRLLDDRRCYAVHIPEVEPEEELGVSYYSKRNYHEGDAD